MSPDTKSKSQAIYLGSSFSTDPTLFGVVIGVILLPLGDLLESFSKIQSTAVFVRQQFPRYEISPHVTFEATERHCDAVKVRKYPVA